MSTAKAINAGRLNASTVPETMTSKARLTARDIRDSLRSLRVISGIESRFSIRTL